MSEALLQSARRHHQGGNFSEAIKLYSEILRANSRNVEALNGLGSIYLLHQQFAEAERFFAGALRVMPNAAELLYNRGCALMGLNRHSDALAVFARVLSLKPDLTEARINRGLALLALNRHREALAAFDKALGERPGLTLVHGNRARAYLALQEYEHAVRACDLALRDHPAASGPLFTKGVALTSLGRQDEALVQFERTISAEPRHVDAHVYRGVVLAMLGHHADALESYRRALALKADYPEAWHNCGIALMALDRPSEAMASFDRALALSPMRSDWWENKATLLSQLGRREEAIPAYDRVIALGSATADVFYNRGNAHAILKNYDRAIADCEAALRLDPDYPYARGVLVHAKLQTCDWDGLEAHKTKVQAALAEGKRVISPFNAKALLDLPADQLRAAELWVAHESPAASVPLAGSGQHGGERIRLVYLSGDFNASAVAILMAPIFERHDRHRFETIAVSYGPTTVTPMRTRLEAAFERFIDVRGQSDQHIARLIHELQADIAIDLTGFTGESRSAILAQRPAPVQVNYLGFPGSMGAPYMDYIVADSVVIPPDRHCFYAEKVVSLPHCFLPADTSRAIAERAPDRVSCGLPAEGFVFASFNNSYKFSPEIFDIWMRLLRSVEGSVLWLPENIPEARRNLFREAERRGVAAERLVFAPILPASEDHLARLGIADLFLDTLPYNAHTTAIDALWAGVPVLTLPGQSFAGRVAASAVRAAGLSETIAETAADYEAKAVAFARDPERLARIKAKLAANRRICPLFDPDRFTRDLEKAFRAMHERHIHSLPPASIAVES